MVNEILKDARLRMDQAVLHTRQEMAKVRTGRANPELLDSLLIDYYGTKTPLKQLSTVSVPEARLITVQPYEKTLIAAIEKAILTSNLGLTPSNNGVTVLVPIPPLSEDRRRDLIKYVHTLVEEGRVAVRNVRRDGIHKLKEAREELNISEDEIHRAEHTIQEYTDEHIEKMNTLQEIKEKEIIEF